MFEYNSTATEITMHAGDTGAFKVKATRASGTDWDEYDRMLFTISNTAGDIMLQRFYRLDDDEGLGNGVIQVEFHNDDTDTWETGQYTTEFRFDVSPIWEGTAPGGRCVNALTANARMIEGSIVRTAIQSSLTINGVQGDI